MLRPGRMGGGGTVTERKSFDEQLEEAKEKPAIPARESHRDAG